MDSNRIVFECSREVLGTVRKQGQEEQLDQAVVLQTESV